METSQGTNIIDPKKFCLLHDMVGGHHLMLKIGDGKILKMTSDEEVKFYEIYKDSIFRFLPRYYFSIDRQTDKELNKLVMEYKIQLDLIFYQIIKDYDEEKQRKTYLNHYKPFPTEIFAAFIKNCEENLPLKKDSDDIKTIEKIISEFCEDKLKYFLNTFIYKLTTTEHQPKFVILEDLTWGIKKPCIIDFKLGYVYANGLSSKRVADISTEKGIRLMGVQYFKNDESIFISRIQGRYYDYEKFYNLIREFFHVSDREKSSILLEAVIAKINNIKEELIKYNIKGGLNSSLLIIYDHDLFSKDSEELRKEQTFLNVKLIDFNYFNKEDDIRNLYEGHEELLKKMELENCISPIENILEILENIK